jgi:ribosome-binding protein aMBF1 (putative translation factor)
MRFSHQPIPSTTLRRGASPPRWPRQSTTGASAAGRAGQEHAPADTERGLSQEALAHECGINRTYLSGVERSERNVSIDNIARIARGLRIEPWKLLRED